MKVGTPHFDFPFRMSSAGAAVVEQDTPDDIAASVQVLLSCPIGFRADFPTFGIGDSALRERGADTREIANALEDWEPRANAEIAAGDPTVQGAIDNVKVRLGG